MTSNNTVLSLLTVNNSATYPCRIWISSFERLTDNLERVEEHGLYERLGVEIEDHLIELDIETGKILTD